MAAKKFLFVISKATSNPMQVIGILKVASNLKAFDDSAEVVIFLIGEGVQLAKKGVAQTISLEMEGKRVNVGELVDVIREMGVKFFICRGFMQSFGVTEQDLIENAEVKSSSTLGEMLLDGFIPFSLGM
jgi:predicted peroxiredoxin